MLHARHAAQRINDGGPFCHAEATPTGIVLTFQSVTVTIPPTGYLPVRVERREPDGIESLYVLANGEKVCRDCWMDYQHEDPYDYEPGYLLEGVEHVPAAEATCANHGRLVDKSDEIR